MRRVKDRFFNESEETDQTFRYKLLPKKDSEILRYKWLSEPKGIQGLFGVADGTSFISTLLFWKDRGWTRAKAEAWLKDRGYRYEPIPVRASE